MKLNPWFVTGLVEGEGCFSVSFTLREKLSVGIETRPSFSLSLNQRDLPLLKRLHDYFNCGAIRFSKSDRTYKFETRSIEDLVNHILPHFNKYQLQGGKRDDFKLFEEICKRVHENLHNSKKHLCEIIEVAYQMNPSGKRRFDKQFLLQKLG